MNVFLLLLLGSAQATRTLQQVFFTPCNQLILDSDIPGPNLPGSPTVEADPQACIDVCLRTDGCNAAIFVPGQSGCYLKTVDLETVEPVSWPGLTSYLVCDDSVTSPPPISAPVPLPPFAAVCDKFTLGADIPGANLPGSATITSSNEDCLALCRSTSACNAMIRGPEGACLLKTVDLETIEPSPWPNLTYYLDCAGGAPEGAEPPLPSSAWKALKTLPVAIGEVSSGVLTANGKDYLITVGQHGNKDPKNGVTFIYDIAEDVWLEGGARPLVGNHHNAEVIDNKFYLFGGLDGGSSGELQIGTLTGGSLDEPLMMNWTQGADSPLDTGSANSAFIGGLVYLCGGIVGATTVPDCSVYDPALDMWTSGAQVAPDMPAGRNHAASCSDGHTMYTFGGRIGGNTVGPGFDDTQIYTPGGDWITGNPLPLARGGMGACVCTGGKCYVFGGEVQPMSPPSVNDKVNTKRTVFRTDIYDIGSDTWSLGPSGFMQDMPEGLHGIFPVLHNGKVYIAGGGTMVTFSQSNLVYEFAL